jgi:hypothetical protein
MHPLRKTQKKFITSRFKTLFGLKNKNGELETYYMGEKRSKGDGRKQVRIPRRMFVGRPQEKNTKLMHRGRFGLMCFLANRNKLDWIDASVTTSMEIALMTAGRTSAGLPKRTTKAAITTKGPGGLMLHELSHALHSKFVKD